MFYFNTHIKRNCDPNYYYSWIYPYWYRPVEIKPTITKEFDELFKKINESNVPKITMVERKEVKIANDKIELKFFLAGYGKEDIDSIEFDKKAKTLKVLFKNKTTVVEKLTSKVNPDTIKVASFDKGILIIEAEMVKPSNEVIKIKID